MQRKDYWRVHISPLKRGHEVDVNEEAVSNLLMGELHHQR
jgi:hypothetical protein